MFSWLDYLRQGLSHTQIQRSVSPMDRGKPAHLANFENLRPFFLRHWRKGLLGVIIVILSSLLMISPTADHALPD